MWYDMSLEIKGNSSHLLHHLALFVEEFHFDVATYRKRLRELKDHVLFFPSCVGRIRRVDFYLQLIHNELRVCLREMERVRK